MEPMMKQSETLSKEPESYAAKRIVGVIFAVIEIILGFRFVFKLLGANPDNGFVKFIYNITQFFVGIFEGIFSQSKSAAFEISTLIAMIIIALLAWIVLKLMTPRKSNLMERTEYTTRPSEPINTVVAPTLPPQQQVPQQQVPQQQVPQQQVQEVQAPWTDANQQNKS